MPSREYFNIMSCDVSDCCSPERLRDELRSNGKIVLLDCRTQVEFCRAHIRGAISITLPTLMQKRLKRGSLNIASVIQNNEAKERFTKNCKSHSIILCDECSTDINANPSSVLSLLLKKLKQDGCKVSFLIGGFSTFQERFPEYCQTQESTDNTILGLCNLRITEDSSYGSCESSGDLENTPHMSPFPVEVLPYLYLGNAKNSADLNQLKQNGIHYILNVTPNVPNMFEDDGNFKYLQIPISDHWSQNLSSFFPDAIAFIDEARNSQQGVLVHCLAGISRSVTVTVAYLMSKQSMCLNEAYDFVKKCKPNISPNFTFMGQLLDFEKALYHENLCRCTAHRSQDEDDGVAPSDSDSDKASPPFEISPL